MERSVSTRHEIILRTGKNPTERDINITNTGKDLQMDIGTGKGLLIDIETEKYLLTDIETGKGLQTNIGTRRDLTDKEIEKNLLK